MLLKGLLLVIDDVAVLNFCRQSEERITAEVRFCAHVLVVSWTYYLNIILAHGFVHHTDLLVCSPSVSAVHAGGLSVLQLKGIVVKTLTECPLHLRSLDRS